MASDTDRLRERICRQLLSRMLVGDGGAKAAALRRQVSLATQRYDAALSAFESSDPMSQLSREISDLTAAADKEAQLFRRRVNVVAAKFAKKGFTSEIADQIELLVNDSQYGGDAK